MAAAPGQKQLLLPPPQQTFQQQKRQPQQQQTVPMQIRPAQNSAPSLRDFFGGFGPRRVSLRRLQPHRRVDPWLRARRGRRVVSADRPKSRRAISRDSNALR